MSDEVKRQKHPAYGLVQFSRQHGGSKKLFGSQIRSDTTIALRIFEGEVQHELSYDRYSHAKNRPIIEVVLSAAQFAELLTTMNMGSGVPCTIEYRDGKDVPPIPETDKAEAQKIHEGFREKLERLVDALKEFRTEAANLLDGKKPLSKAEKEAIKGVLDKTIMEVESNAPFVLEQFTESTEKIVVQAKAEVEAFASHAVQVAGLEALSQGRVPQTLITDGKGNKK